MILTASIMDTIKYGPCITVLTKSTKKIYPKEKIQKKTSRDWVEMCDFWATIYTGYHDGNSNDPVRKPCVMELERKKNLRLGGVKILRNPLRRGDE